VKGEGGAAKQIQLRLAMITEKGDSILLVTPRVIEGVQKNCRKRPLTFPPAEIIL